MSDIDSRRVEHWRRTKSLMVTTLIIWAVFSFLVHWFAPALNNFKLPVLDFPLGFYMAAQGSEILFVVLIFWFASRQDRIDRDTGFAEE